MLTTAEQEVRKEFEEWFTDSAAKDLDAVMSKIADDIVSYEHETPLEYVGSDAIREVCRKGFEVMQGNFRWDVHDLEIIVRDDIAVAWGLNHMQAEDSGKQEIDMWSRGTRVFRKIDGAWKMIHQHVSFPRDPASGLARTDLKP